MNHKKIIKEIRDKGCWVVEMTLPSGRPMILGVNAASEKEAIENVSQGDELVRSCIKKVYK